MRSFNLHGYANAQWYDLTSFVDRDITVPIWTRNKNGTPTAEGFQFGLVDTISSSILQNLERVKFSVDGISRFLGTVTKKRPVVTKRIWEYNLLNAINEMDSYNIKHSEIDSFFVNSIDPYKYKTFDNLFYSNVSLPWLLECLLIKSNLPCNANALYNESAINIVVSRKDIQYLRDIRFDTFMIYAINQEVATYYSVYDADASEGYNFSENRISGFKLFTILCGTFGITHRFENDVYVLERREGQTTGERYIINQSNIYDDSGGDFIGKKVEGKNFTMKGSDRINYYYPYQISALRNFGTSANGKGGTIQWYNNLIPLFQDKTKIAGETQNMDAGNHLDPVRDLGTSLYFKENNWNETVFSIEGAIQNSFYNVDEHYINPRKERSIIKQGVYS